MKSIRHAPPLRPRERNRSTDVGEVVLRLHSALVARGVPERRIRSAIAEACGVSPQSVFHWFNGRTKMPRADHLAKVSLAFDIDLLWLIMGEESATVATPKF